MWETLSNIGNSTVDFTKGLFGGSSGGVGTQAYSLGSGLNSFLGSEAAKTAIPLGLAGYGMVQQDKANKQMADMMRADQAYKNRLLAISEADRNRNIQRQEAQEAGLVEGFAKGWYNPLISSHDEN